ncbi:MAG: DEAD/DEAH box helicase [Microcystis sp. M54BS1]|uniref:DEAD/DEAH box helicase n=1 Tax=unclassified Microcystis TaxID=2643300 RepID=UPI00257EB738|nr:MULTISPECIES: DEAD/DEAH box helicase [unclassified Microcystis]MCA2537952.1 DEAD/DEAH box helicase [Microcystis sp. M54BS1]MCA2598039.1 DEAD/DEAH box helicase [Microcystis sp. M38BS1]MCA2612916.1 DEAD/DEAH box helicase [Microcystis sp. M27BS1]MCA2506827.1 DEAD/DEAH box helicase [Microcystis sp. M62BS1]MCA2509422.1 DEAD/DEAH box helicase [Microcystis sp. M60BS1]
MANPNPRTDQLPKQQPRWRHLPTRAIRVPEILLGDIERYARSLDNGERIEQTIEEFLETASIEELLSLKQNLEKAIERAKARSKDSRLENAIIYLSDQCDGTRKEDGRGFNKVDTEFGHWLARRIASGSLLKHQAKAGLKMIQKYQKSQLEPAGYTLPDWEAIEAQYPDKFESKKEESPYRIEILDNKIAVYAPYDSTGRFQKKAKAIEGYRFDSSDKSWRYPLAKVIEVIEAFPSPEYSIDPEIEGIKLMIEGEKAAELAEREKEAETAANDILNLVAAAELDRPLAGIGHLFGHQKEAVKWLLAHRTGGIYRGGILADDMGLGKTLSALVAARAMAKIHGCPVFVICPASLKDNWLREAAKAGATIEVFSWAKMPKALESQKYLIIADEAHYAQNENSKRTKELKALADHENCLGTWLLTGTPIKNGRPINLFPLLQIIQHPLAADPWEFQKYYCNAHHKAIGSKSIWDNTGAAHLDELSKKTEDVILRRRKAECLDLPPKLRSLVPILLEGEASKNYRQEIDRHISEYREREKRGEVKEGAEALVTINALRKVGSLYKVPAAIESAAELLEQGQAVVIFTEYLESAKALYTALSQIAPCELLTGETKQEERQAIIDRFQSGTSKIFIGTIKAGGVGLTLTAANQVILVDRPWTPGDADQAEDRCYRIGQNNTVNAYWIQLGAIDEAIDALLAEKRDRIELVLKGKRKTLRGLSKPSELAKELLEIL